MEDSKFSCRVTLGLPPISENQAVRLLLSLSPVGECAPFGSHGMVVVVPNMSASLPRVHTEDASTILPDARLPVGGKHPASSVHGSCPRAAVDSKSSGRKMYERTNCALF